MTDLDPTAPDGEIPDLTPRRDAAGADTPRKSWRNRLIVGSFALVVAFLLFQALSSARVFFYNVDEAIERQDELGDRTFRMQGTVVSDPVKDGSGAMVFTVAFEEARAEVRHTGVEPSDLFDVGQPVVVQGNWSGQQFHSSQILVKHDESYVEDNPARVEYDLPEGQETS